MLKFPGKVLIVGTGLILSFCGLTLLYKTPYWSGTSTSAVDTNTDLARSVTKKMSSSLWNMDEVKQMTREEAAAIYHGYVNSLQTHCGNRVRVGNMDDGGWDLCFDKRYRPSSSCLVYSFGINDDWSFDDGMALNYGCEVYAYDPSMTSVEEHDRGKKIHFRRTGINNTDGVNGMGWRMRTFSSILKENGHTDSIIDVLKLDIEASEWLVFPEMIQSRSLKNVKQMCFEIHLKKPNISKDKYLKGLQMLKDIYKEGFRIFKTHRNAGTIFHPINEGLYKYELTRAGCHELCMVKDLSLLEQGHLG